MFESIGFSEMLLVAVIALIVLGPEKFPEYAKIFLRASRDLQGYIRGIREDLAKEVNPLKKEFDSIARQDPEKLLDAFMKTDEVKEKPAAEYRNDGSKELVAGQSDTPESDADGNPYAERPAQDAAAASTPAAEAPAEESKPAEENKPVWTGDGAAYAESQEFQYKPPERMD